MPCSPSHLHLQPVYLLTPLFQIHPLLTVYMRCTCYASWLHVSTTLCFQPHFIGGKLINVMSLPLDSGLRGGRDSWFVLNFVFPVLSTVPDTY